jgi:hypothetical protein
MLLRRAARAINPASVQQIADAAAPVIGAGAAPARRRWRRHRR